LCDCLPRNIQETTSPLQLLSLNLHTLSTDQRVSPEFFIPHSLAYNMYGYQGHSQGAPPPPSGQQAFGHGAPAGYTFQYSNCTGRRKALLIGINYFGQKGELRGCINDANNVAEFLVERYGYRREDMVILTDDQRNPVGIPTKQNIIRAMGWLVGGAQPNDALFLHYSGKLILGLETIKNEKALLQEKLILVRTWRTN
jgi:hypothetical protein